jgi:SAM-dependent methyltransferase
VSRAEFDEFAKDYRSLHAQNVAITGEEPEYFAEYKMRDFAQLVRQTGGPADGRYLDFGSGVGASVAPFRRHLPQAQLLCADVSAESLAASRIAHGDGPDYLLINGASLDLPDASVDGGFACCVFHHIPPAQHLAALSELRRVLKADAPLMIYEHNPLNPLTVRAVNTCPLDVNAILIRAGEMARRCAQAGFSSTSVDYRVFFPATLKAWRRFEDRMRWLPLGAQYFVHARR